MGLTGLKSPFPEALGQNPYPYALQRLEAATFLGLCPPP